MKKTLYRVGVAVAAIAVTTALVAGATWAADSFGKNGGQEKFAEKHQEMKQIMENNDYQAWKEMAERQGMDADMINEDNFEKMVMAHKMMQEGRGDEAREMLEEAGLKPPMMGRKMKKPMYSKEERQKIMDALDNNDYQAWREAMAEDSKALEVINEDNFPRLVEAHNLMKEGKSKMEEARKIKEELGLAAKGPKFAQE